MAWAWLRTTGNTLRRNAPAPLEPTPFCTSVHLCQFSSNHLAARSICRSGQATVRKNNETRSMHRYERNWAALEHQLIAIKILTLEPVNTEASALLVCCSPICQMIMHINQFVIQSIMTTPPAGAMAAPQICCRPCCYLV